jgi:hypothetical protein
MNQVQFNVNETFLVLRSNLFMSWGVEKLVNVDGRDLMMKVNGHHHCVWVLITLDEYDWYRVHILTQFGEVLDS